MCKHCVGIYLVALTSIKYKAEWICLIYNRNYIVYYPLYYKMYLYLIYSTNEILIVQNKLVASLQHMSDKHITDCSSASLLQAFEALQYSN